jgi:peptidyl-prolyl cis-trans isomerase B (cyclophilin B)
LPDIDLKQFEMPKAGDTVAEIHVKDYGVIKVKFFPNQAPNAVKNFTTHAEEGYYDGVTFHRVIEDFMIQGGDPTGTGAGGESIWGKGFEEEITEDVSLFPYRGALCMANAGAGTSTNGSQFFIVQAKDSDKDTASQMTQAGYPSKVVKAYEEWGGTPWLFTKHTVFGQVYEGLDVVDKIAAVKTGDNDRPKKDVVIEKIVVTEYEEETENE